jgi:hypothetical protein
MGKHTESRNGNQAANHGKKTSGHGKNLVHINADQIQTRGELTHLE